MAIGNNGVFDFDDGDITEDEDFLAVVNIIFPLRKNPVFRVRENHFHKWSDNEFLNRFRLPKETVFMLVDRIRDRIAHLTNRNHAVMPETMVLLTMRFYASGSMIITVADFCGIDKSTACRIIHRVSDAIANLYRVFIKMPSTEEEINSKIFEFYQLSRFTQCCIGALDCTHIKIQSPGGNDAEIFRNRKGYFSFNVQVVCDANLKIQDIVCRWPGCSHDSTILNNSRLRYNFEAGQGLRVKRNRIEAIVVATAILHNIAKEANVPEPDVSDELRQTIEEDLAANLNANNNVHFEQNGRLNNNTNRLSIIHNHFARLLQ